MNVCVFGYFHFADGYYAYGQYFKRHFNTVSFVPFVEFCNLHKRNLVEFTDIDKIISGDTLDTSKYSKSLVNFLVPKHFIIIAHNNEFMNSYKTYFEYIFSLKSKYNFKIIQFNWDAYINHSIKPFLPFDLSFCCDPYYFQYKNVRYFRIGYSPVTSFYQYDPNYECDVSFVGTNLYAHPRYQNQTTGRKQILDLLYADKSIKLHVYGPKFLGELYPDSYKGYISYNNCYRVFSNSKINLNISPLYDSIKTKKKYNIIYYSERVPQILACNGIMLSNNNYYPLLRPHHHYIYLESLDLLLSTVKYFLNNPSEIQLMKQHVHDISHKFNYETTVKKISNQLVKLNPSISSNKNV